MQRGEFFYLRSWAISCFLPNLWVPERAAGLVQTSFVVVGFLCVVWELCDVKCRGTNFRGYWSTKNREADPWNAHIKVETSPHSPWGSPASWITSGIRPPLINHFKFRNRRSVSNSFIKQCRVNAHSRGQELRVKGGIHREKSTPNQKKSPGNH